MIDQSTPISWADILRTEDLDAAIKDLKASLLMWMIPTTLSSIALGVTLGRLA